MLAGLEDSDTARAHAQELLATAAAADRRTDRAEPAALTRPGALPGSVAGRVAR